MNVTKVVTLAFIVSLSAMLGSLFFSDVMKFIPCTLCWYQRIFMYPLVFIFLVNLLYPDNNLFKYAMPITIIGLFTAFYHNLLMWRIISESITPCSQGVPCSVEYISWLGFINIPLLSLVAYIVIFTLLMIIRKKENV